MIPVATILFIIVEGQALNPESAFRASCLQLVQVGYRQLLFLLLARVLGQVFVGALFDARQLKFNPVFEDVRSEHLPKLFDNSNVFFEQCRYILGANAKLGVDQDKSLRDVAQHFLLLSLIFLRVCQETFDVELHDVRA